MNYTRERKNSTGLRPFPESGARDTFLMSSSSTLHTFHVYPFVINALFPLTHACRESFTWEGPGYPHISHKQAGLTKYRISFFHFFNNLFID
jgi:hypothetical protein